MSLLLKALKQAEQSQSQPASEQAQRPSAIPELEPIDPPFSSHRDWVQPHTPASEQKSSRMAFALPQIGLVPATALIALIIALGYGVYVYLAISQPAMLTSGPVQPPTQPAASPPPARPILPPTPAILAEKAPAKPVAPRIEQAPAPAKTSHARRVPRNPVSTTNAPAGKPAATPAPIEQIHADSPPATLSDAYLAYQAGHLDEARALYEKVPNHDRNTDALLGLAAIAMAQDRKADGVQFYQRVIALDPHNTTAQAALIDALGTVDNTAAEARLKSQIELSPSAYLYYTLGNLYADQNRWSDAEPAYFEAVKRDAANADYAYNLATSLDHLRQFDAALKQYQAALSLAGPGTQFDRTLAQARVRQLRER